MPDAELPATPEGWTCVETWTMPVVPPYRLDLTVAVLQRTATNPVDVWTAAGCYLRVCSTPGGPEVQAVTQAPGAAALQVALYRPQGAAHGTPPEGGPAPAPQPVPPAPAAGPGEAPRARHLSRALGTEVDLGGFYAQADDLPGLGPLAVAARGVKPPRYPALWEAICNAVVFQQVSIEAASATMRRFIAHFSTPVLFGDQQLYAFPAAGAVLPALPDVGRSLGLSAAKVRALQEAGALLQADTLRAAELAALPTPAALARLTALRGIGPWTAAVIMLRGFGRLDVFPLGDSGVLRSLRGLLGPDADPAPALATITAALGPWRGMFYYHLLLWRLAGRGRVHLAADGPRPG